MEMLREVDSLMPELTMRRVVLLGVVVWCVVAFIRWFRGVLYVWKCRRQVMKIPGPKALPFIGNLHQIPKPLDDRFLKYIQGLSEQYPYCFPVQSTPYRANLVVNHPRVAKQILRTSEPKDTLRGGPYGTMLPWLGEGLLTSYGEQWFRNRRLLTPAFHFDVLKPYMTIFNECADILLDKWESCAERNGSMDISPDISLCTLNVIMRCAFSYGEDVQRLGTSHPYVDAVYKIANIVATRPLRPWTHFELLYSLTSEGRENKLLCDYVHNVADDVIQKRKAVHESEDFVLSKKAKLDFLDILLSARDEDGSGLTDQEIRQEVDTFLFEGHDTTASGISWILYALATHPEYQERARQEVDSILKGKEKPIIEWDDLSNMPYLTQCIKEGMRCHSPVPMIVRRLTKPTVIEGVEVLPDTAITLSLHHIHHNPLVWGEDHMEYKPDRFLPENINKMDSHAFCPFSAGPRNCIGQNFALYEEKVEIARILHRYKLSVDSSLPEPRPIPELVMRSMNGIHIRLSKRDDL